MSKYDLEIFENLSSVLSRVKEACPCNKPSTRNPLLGWPLESFVKILVYRVLMKLIRENI